MILEIRKAQEIEMSHLKQELRSLRTMSIDWQSQYMQYQQPQFSNYRVPGEVNPHRIAAPSTRGQHMRDMRDAPQQATVGHHLYY